MSSRPQRGLAVLGIVGLAVLFVPSTSTAQQPKLDIKLFAGASSTTYVALLESGRERDTFIGWQVGFGPRYRKRRWFVEALFSFNRWALRFNDQETGIRLKGRVNSFELPINAGFIPYKNPYFKLFLYAGLVNHFNTRIIVTASGEDGTSVNLRLRPKEVEFAIYQALARFGINFDLAMFNFDFNYSISMNSASQTSERTSYHQLQLNVAYLF
jgi:hypothetical protein